MNDDDFPLKITPEAADALKKALSYDDQSKLRVGMIRVAIQGGGCSGLQYKLDIDDINTIRDDDFILELEDGVTIVVDGYSATVLRGTTLNYIDTLMSAGFKFDNPNAKRHCGCGSSFGA